jgi:Polyketide cyclase / dehydrase and lipid transport
MSDSRQQAWIQAPIDVVWDLIADVDNHPAWWPRIVESECDELGEGCTYRQVVHTPFGEDEMLLRIEAFDNCEEFRIRCVNTGTFVRFALTPAQAGTFVEGRMGMEPDGLADKVFDAVAGRIYFRRWLAASIEAMARIANERAKARDAA